MERSRNHKRGETWGVENMLGNNCGEGRETWGVENTLGNSCGEGSRQRL